MSWNLCPDALADALEPIAEMISGLQPMVDTILDALSGGLNNATIQLEEIEQQIKQVRRWLPPCSCKLLYAVRSD